VFHRYVREGQLTRRQAQALLRLFEQDIQDEVWALLPVSAALMRKVAQSVRGLPANVLIRAGDAVHLVTALEYGFTEIWTNDRRMLDAAPHFGLKGKSV
jgi:predicted nucleic acid-binding protein